MTSSSRGLLTLRDAAPVNLINRGGASEFLLIGDHAGNLIPERLADLGLSAQDRRRHIALDIGVSRLGRRLGEMLDAPFIEQRYSRLVIDCNRQIWHDGSIAEVSDGTAVPGNAKLSRFEAEVRIDEIFRPYHAAIAQLIQERQSADLRTILVSLHSFTPQLGHTVRPWEIGVLYSEGDTRFARAVLASLHAQGGLALGDNEPYQMDETDFTVPHHAFADSIPYAEVEIRQDEVSNGHGVERIAAILARALNEAAGATEIDFEANY